MRPMFTYQTTRSIRAIVPLSALVCLLLCANVSHAMAIYTYTGNNFDEFPDNFDPPSGTYTTAMSVTGTFAVAVPLTLGPAVVDISGDVLSYSFSDGRSTLTEANSNMFNFNVGVTAGQIVAWSIELRQIFPVPTAIGDLSLTIRTVTGGDRGSIQECISLLGDLCFDAGLDLARVNGNPGTWETVVPIPPAIWLFGSALGLLGWIRRRST